MKLARMTPNLFVRDLPLARSFWTDVLGFEETEDSHDDFASFTMNGLQVNVVKMDGDEGLSHGEKQWIDFDAFDVNYIYKSLKAKSVKFGGEMTSDGEVFHFEIFDPENNKLSFAQVYS